MKSKLFFGIAQTNLTDELIIDGFAGGGGASTGIELAVGRPVDIAINHDPAAVSMHKANHPYTEHYCESIFEVDPIKVCRGRPVAYLHISPDCTHFSKARGGTPVKKEIRGLAWIGVEWAEKVRPRVITLENVEEFLTWGPIDEKTNKPIKERSGETFREFVAKLESLGYSVKWKILKACDYGAPTTRKRLYLAARCDGIPIAFPSPTHGNPESEAVKAGKLLPYRTAAGCIDFSIPTPSIFERSKPLAENTHKRIARGIDKFVIKRGTTLNNPIPTLDTSNRHALTIGMLSKAYGGNYKGAGSHPDEPLHTITEQYHNSLVAAHIQKYYGNTEDCGTGIKEPIHTLTSKDRMAFTTSHLTILRKNMDGKTLDKPMPTLTASGGHMAEVRTYLVRYDGGGYGYWPQIRELLNNYSGYHLADDEIILFAIKSELYYMSDIGMRMLSPRELYNAQGFPPDYIIDHGADGKPMPKSEQVKKVGNSVCPAVMTAWVKVLLPELCAKENLKTMEELNRRIAV